jgi:hypothetical protein
MRILLFFFSSSSFSISLCDSNEPFVPSVNTLEGQGMNTLFRNFVGDQGIKFCSKIQSAWNLLQTGQERRSRRYEPNATHFVSNGRREQDISRSIRIVKQAKKRTLTVQSVQAYTLHVAGIVRHVRCRTHVQ